jgi:non-specific serine/threonine protein kinase
MAAGGEPVAADVPRALGSFIGRARETAEIGSLSATARLLTLTGTGGSGKTRLAARVADEMRDGFRDSVRWVELGALTDPSLVPYAVAARCGVTDLGSAAVLDALVSALRPRHMLLALDNCEHLLAACAQLVETLLASCPDLHILATSREALAIPGEVTWLVPPLGVPEEDTFSSEENLLAHEAVELFVARAGAVLPGFYLTAENAASIVRICRRVEGLPLALELAAARLRTLSVAELAERLDDACRLLTRGSRTAPPRQQTLRATLDWSYDLLPETERTVFRRLAVFAGSYSLEAAEAVCAGEGVAEAEVLDLLTHLVERSLVSVQDRRDKTRYRLLEPLRQYARDRLAETGDEPAVRRRHGHWYAALAARAGTELTGPDQGRWLDRLAIEHDNLRAAFDWSLDQSDAAGAAEITVGIWQFWLLRGHLHEGRRWVERALEAGPEPTPLRAHLHRIAGILARPDSTRAERRFNESLALWQTLGDRDGAARALGSLGFLAQARGDHGRAVAYLEQSLPLLRASTDTPALARTLTGLALSVLEVGDAERAAALCGEGLALSRQAGDRRGEAAALANLGLIRRARGDDEGAAALWGESLSVRRRIGDRGGTAHVLALLGGVALRRGDLARATELFHESLTLRREMGDQDGIAPIFEGLAAIGAARGDDIPAVRLAAAADALRAATGVPRSSPERAGHDRALTSLRARLDRAEFARAWSEGQALSLDQAIGAAMSMRVREGHPGLGASAPALPPAGAVPAPPAAFELTPRETEVLRLLTFGLTYAQIAEALVISPRTVDAHVRAIFGKLDVRSRTAATRVALQHHLVCGRRVGGFP